MTALLVARAARITVDDVVAIAGLSLETRGSKLVVVGHTDPLMAALSGIPHGVTAAASIAATQSELVPVAGAARATSGELRLAGKDVVAREHLAIVGAAPLDPPMPGDWSAESYAIEVARLAMPEGSASEAATRAKKALERAGLTGARKRSVKSLQLPERRALVLAAAVAANPAVLIADRPLAGLEGAGAQFVLGALEAACADRPSVVSISQLTPASAEGRLGRAATDFAAFVTGELAMFGPPSEVLGSQKLFRITVRSNAAALSRALTDQGASLEGGPTHFTLRLTTEQDPSFVLRVASEVRSAVVAIVPVV